MKQFLIGILVYSIIAGVYYRITVLIFIVDRSSMWKEEMRNFNIIMSVFFPIFIWVLIAKVSGEWIFNYIKKQLNKES